MNKTVYKKDLIETKLSDPIKTSEICKVFQLLKDKNIQTSFVEQVSETSYISKFCLEPPVYWTCNLYPTNSFKLRNPECMIEEFDPPLMEVFYLHKPYNFLIDIETEQQKFLLENYEWVQDAFDHNIIEPNYKLGRLELNPRDEVASNPIHVFKESYMIDEHRRFVCWELLFPLFCIILDHYKNVNNLILNCGYLEGHEEPIITDFDFDYSTTK